MFTTTVYFPAGYFSLDSLTNALTGINHKVGDAHLLGHYLRYFTVADKDLEVANKLVGETIAEVMTQVHAHDSKTVWSYLPHSNSFQGDNKLYSWNELPLQ